MRPGAAKGGTNEKATGSICALPGHGDPSFGAEHVVIRSAKVVGHTTCQTTKDVGHAGVAVVKFLA
jgi:hypothetical protein